MILNAADGIKGKVVDLDTGRVVRGVKLLNTDTGYLEAYHVDANGKPKRDAGGRLLPTYQAVGRFRFEPADGNRMPVKLPVQLGADRCAKCGSSRTLLGDDLCPTCRAVERGQKHRMRAEPLTNPLEDHSCHECTRRASWCVSDEVAVTPQAGKFASASALFERVQVVDRRWYCSWHFKPPRLLDARGEEIAEVGDDKVRPQWG